MLLSKQVKTVKIQQSVSYCLTRDTAVSNVIFLSYKAWTCQLLLKIALL